MVTEKAQRSNAVKADPDFPSVANTQTILSQGSLTNTESPLMSTRKKDFGMKIRCLSLFAGIGGFDLGLQMAASERDFVVELVAYSEVKKPAIKVLNDKWPEARNLGDITQITNEQLDALGQIDLVVGGFPCSNLSSAVHGNVLALRQSKTVAKSQHAGLEGPKSRLFWELVRVLKHIRPRYWTVENVASMSNAWVEAITDALRDALSTPVQPANVYLASINAGNFLPMRRARLFWSNFPVTSDRDIPPMPLQPFVTLLENPQPDKDRHEKFLRVLLGTRAGKLRLISAMEYSDTGESHCRPITASAAQLLGTACILIDWRHTMTEMGGGRIPLLRKFLVVEVERLMGFPEGWTQAAASDTARKDLLGNAIAPQVAKHVFSCMFDGCVTNGATKQRFGAVQIEPQPIGRNEFYQTAVQLQKIIDNRPREKELVEEFDEELKPLLQHFLQLHDQATKTKRPLAQLNETQKKKPKKINAPKSSLDNK